MTNPLTRTAMMIMGAILFITLIVSYWTYSSRQKVEWIYILPRVIQDNDDLTE